MYLIYTVPVDVLAPQDARPSTVTVLKTPLDIVLSGFQIPQVSRLTLRFLFHVYELIFTVSVNVVAHAGRAFHGHRADRLTE